MAIPVRVVGRVIIAACRLSFAAQGPGRARYVIDDVTPCPPKLAQQRRERRELDLRYAMNVLVVGGAGYIGSATCASLETAGHEVTVYDDLSTGHRGALPDSTRLVVGSSADEDRLEQLFAAGNFDVVIDFAAVIQAAESMLVPERYFRNNTANALSVVETMLRHGVPRFVFSSSAAVYGNPEIVPIEESAPLQPTNAYGESKRAFEEMLRWINEAHQMRVGILRYFNAAGALRPDAGEDHRPETHLIPLVLRCALGKVPEVDVFGTDYDTKDGTCVRDFVHVVDLASAHVDLVEALDRNEVLIYNLGNGAGFSVLEVIEAVRRVTGAPIPVSARPRRRGDPAALVANAQKIRDELGWRPLHSGLEEIVESAWRWHDRHPDGFAN